MKRGHLAIYVVTLMLGMLGGVCLPKAWYQQPAPKITAAHSGGHIQSALLADHR